MREMIIGPEYIKGRVKASRVNGTIWMPTTDWIKNLIMYDWAAIVSHLIADGAANYRINGMFLEYKNVASPSDAVSAPSLDRSGGIDYYLGLSSSADIDYLRVPLTAATRDNSDPTTFNDTNRVTFFAQSQGVAGVNGKPFSDANNSKVFGAALAAMPVAGDRTKDLVFARFYFTSGNQQIKLPSSQIGLTWEEVLG